MTQALAESQVIQFEVDIERLHRQVEQAVVSSVLQMINDPRFPPSLFTDPDKLEELLVHMVDAWAKFIVGRYIDETWPELQSASPITQD